MILDSKQVQRSNFIMSHQKNGDLIVKFDDNETCHAQHRNVPNMHYIGKVVKLPTLEHGTHTIKYSNDQPCKIGDVVFFNGCHYVLAKSANYPFLEWVSLDTSEFEFKSLTKLQYDLSSVSSVVSSLQISCDAIPNALVNPEGNDGYILTLDSEKQLVWKALSSTTQDTGFVKIDDNVIDPSNPTEPDSSQYVVTTTQKQTEQPTVYRTNIALSSVSESIKTTEDTQSALINSLSIFTQPGNRTVGQVRDALKKLSDFVNKKF